MVRSRWFVTVLSGAFALAGHFARSAEPAVADKPDWIQTHAPNLESNISRVLRYQPEGGDFVITNGSEFFNRPLYCQNTAFRVDGGDKPEFSFYCPGRGGNLRLGIRTPDGEKWLHEIREVVTRYRPGSLLYEIRDPLLGKGTMNLAVLPLAAEKGIILRASLDRSTKPVALVWAFAGANGQRGSRGGDIGCEREPVSEYFQLRPEECRGNSFSIASNSFVLRGGSISILGRGPAGSSLSIADATRWGSLGELIASTNEAGALPVILGQTELKPGKNIFFEFGDISGTNEAGTVRNQGADISRDFAAAEEHRRAIADRVVVDTPDAFINSAARAINVAGDAIWDEGQGAYMHGAVAWRTKLLGWRGPYVADELGWHDRAVRHLSYWAGRQNTDAVPEQMPGPDPAANLARDEPALHSNGDLSNSHYDMNLVYIDALFRHLLWTGNLDFARQQWPVIERHLAWERRLFRRTFGPDNLPLYEAYAAIWASDNMNYDGGGTAHATAYNLYHNRMAARVARLIGKDPAPYDHEAELISRAMEKYLWLSDRGWLGESKDLLGLQQTHPNAGLWTFYHAVDSEAMTPFEAWEMSRFVDTQIPHIPLRGPGIPTGDFYTLSTTSWMPYIWSLNNVVMAESAHTSLAYWESERPDEAYRLFKGCLLDSMYSGLCPGNLGMTTAFDVARREAQRDFGDAVGTVSRAMVEGLFGIHPDALAGELRIRPGFPADWGHASIHHPDFDFSFERKRISSVSYSDVAEHYAITSRFQKPMAVRLQIAGVHCRVDSVKVNGRTARWRVMDDSIGAPRIEIVCPAAPRIDVNIKWAGPIPASLEVEGHASLQGAVPVVAKDGAIELKTGEATIQNVFDPEHALTNVTRNAGEVKGTVSGMFGQRTVFVKVQQGDLNWWSAAPFEIRPALEVLSRGSQDADGARFWIRNNTTEAIDAAAIIHAGDEVMHRRISAKAMGESGEIVVPADRLLPGTQHVLVELEDGRRVEGEIVDWNLRVTVDAVALQSVDLHAWFNDSVTQIFKNKYLSPRSPYCSLAMPEQGLGGWADYRAQFNVDDSGFRAAAREGERYVLPDGIPFSTASRAGDRNIVFTSQWDGYRREISIPIFGNARHAYFLMAGSSGAMQSRFDNGEVVVTYGDGSTQQLALNNPVNWWPIDQDYFIDDIAFRRTEAIPPRVDLKTGKVRVLDVDAFKGLGREVSGGAATVLDLPLDASKELKAVTVRALANEVVVGVMGITLVR